MRTLVVTVMVAAVLVVTAWMRWGLPWTGDAAMERAALDAQVSGPGSDVVRTAAEASRRDGVVTRAGADAPARSAVQRGELPDGAPAGAGRSERLVQDIERALRSFDEQERESLFTDMLPELIADDAAAAGRLVERLERGPARDQLREHVAQKWAAHDPEGAIGWAASLENDGERKLAASDISAQLARADPAAAIEVADQFGVGRDDGSLEYVAQTWAETNFGEALAWVQSRPRSAQRDQLLARIARVQASRDLPGAAALIASEMEPGPAQREAALSVLREWAARDPEAAVSWASQFSDARLLEQAKAEVTRAARLQ